METDDSGSAASKAAAVAGTARDKAGDVTSVASGQAGQLASSVADSARQVGGVAAAQVQNLAGEAKRTVHQQAQSQTEQLAGALGRLRDQAGALVDGRPDEAGSLRDHASTVVERLDSLTRRLESGGFDGAVRDLQQFARRRPVAFLAGAGVLGFAAGRLLRAGREVSGGDGAGSPNPYGAIGGPSPGGHMESLPPVYRGDAPGLGLPAASAAGEPTIPMPSPGLPHVVPPVGVQPGEVGAVAPSGEGLDQAALGSPPPPPPYQPQAVPGSGS